MDETTFLVALLDPASVTGASITPTEIESGIDNDWNGSAEKVFGGGYATKAPTPTIVDIRNMTRNKAARYDLSSTVGSDSLKINQIYFGARTESNDRNKRLFGYKITVELKRFAVAIP